MELAQAATGCVLHHQKGPLLLHVVVEQANDTRMREPDQGARLGEKARDGFRSQRCREYFDGRLASQVNLLAQVDVRKSSASQQAREAVIPKLLTDERVHIADPFRSQLYSRCAAKAREAGGLPPLPKQALYSFLDDPGCE